MYFPVAKSAQFWQETRLVVIFVVPVKVDNQPPINCWLYLQFSLVFVVKNKALVCEAVFFHFGKINKIAVKKWHFYGKNKRPILTALIANLSPEYQAANLTRSLDR